MNVPDMLYQAKWKERFVVPADYDQTPVEGNNLSRLDSYLCDKSVLGVITAVYPWRPHWKWETWAVENPHDADAYFSAPYCDVAVRELGYPKTTWNESDVESNSGDDDEVLVINNWVHPPVQMRRFDDQR
jgi:hypothetical protein